MKRLKHILKETAIIIGIILFVIIGSAIDSIVDLILKHFAQ